MLPFILWFLGCYPTIVATHLTNEDLATWKKLIVMALWPIAVIALLVMFFASQIADFIKSIKD